MTPSPGKLLDLIGYEFGAPELFQKALTHRSAGSRNNERLEFLGDAVLGCVIAEELFRCYPDAREGELSRLRATLVRRETLAEIAHDLDIGHFIRLGTGERKSGGHHRDSILSDAVEAVFGAIYLDGGFDAARQVILSLYAEKFANVMDIDELKDAKTRLQEYLQSRQQPLPQYDMVEMRGKAHDRSFRVTCTVDVDGTRTTRGEGKSRRQAEQKAAALMLSELAEG